MTSPPETKSKESLATQRRYDRQAALYDLIEVPVEFLVFKRLRRRLWSHVQGTRVLEIGVGTGKNVPHYPEGTRAVMVDISPRMLRRAARRARRLEQSVDLILADAQHLPFRDNAFDTAVATFVFCSVPDPISGLKEVRRVVRDGGHVHLLEHVRAGNPFIGSLMDLANPIAVRLSGANINRETVSNVEKAGIALNSVESHGFGILKLIRGSARHGPWGQNQREPLSQEVMRNVARRPWHRLVDAMGWADDDPLLGGHHRPGRVGDPGPDQKGVQPDATPRPGAPRPTALDIAEERYARGDITHEEFEQINRDLAGS